MTTETRDPQFAINVDEIVNAIQWPDTSFTLSPLEAAVGVVVAFYDAFATPDRSILRHALNGIAF
ncbi:MAG: hypothetical protein DRH23_01245 [Deltaproteobacteria bacterium]|nr:hypothetical protein [Deltaproteobacteria bacterium]MBW2223840.1 hypothetical protein [Deltaproteobacteria bacterium]MBW2405519.1 hypothetical protein [Deltaproteobacteria bacterium]MBW2549035.1 hypothetical protein [Deltaproteobacteria bacterium]MBW2720539.1 hypothetical protein [Deltaproteobacteria bacterium]